MRAPGYAGIPGNELANEMARSTSASAPTFSLLTRSDLLIHLKNNLTETWTTHFNSDISHRIQPSIPSNPWFVNLLGFTSKSIVAICRLRFEHHCLPATLARFIPYLSPYCPFHPHTLTLATLNHIFLECPNPLPSIKNLKISSHSLVLLDRGPVPSLLTTKDPLIYYAFAQFRSQLPTPTEI